ncbi:MAG TPA: DUF2934 domain-containing protein [Opitutaceae bacterium]|nr:DUF2934 domain-containing protein [Opitutaceae bacterium]
MKPSASSPVSHPSEIQGRPSPEEISQLARELWERSGRPSGRDTEIWLEAEQQLIAASERRPEPTPVSRPAAVSSSSMPTKRGAARSKSG